MPPVSIKHFDHPHVKLFQQVVLLIPKVVVFAVEESIVRVHGLHKQQLIITIMKTVNFGVNVSEFANANAVVAAKWCTVKDIYLGYRAGQEPGANGYDAEAPEKGLFCIIRLNDVVYSYVENRGILLSNKIICSFYELRQLFAGGGKSSLADIFRQKIYAILPKKEADGTTIMPENGFFIEEMRGLTIEVSQVIFNEENEQGMYLVKSKTLNEELATEREYDHPVVLTRLLDYRLDVSDTRMFQLAQTILEHKSETMKVKAVAFSMKRTKFLYMDEESEAIWQQVVDELSAKQEQNSNKTVAQSTVDVVLATLQAQLNQAVADGNVDAMVKLADAISKFK